jgi:galactose mutarotase-like enzyme
MTSDSVTIASPQLSAEISPLGAELQALRDAEGRDLLWDGDPAFWTGRAPILFPTVGTLPDDRYRLGDRTFTLPRHGFARRKIFSVDGRGADRVTFRLKADDDTRAVYPFEFRLDLVFAIDGARLAMTGILTNTGDRPLPAGFGFHPAFRWPLPYGEPRAAHEIVFEADEPAPIRRLGRNSLVAPEPVPTPVHGRVLKLEDGLFVNDAIIMTDPVSRHLTYGAPKGPRLAIDYADFPQLGIWTKPGAGYVCIEPWQSFATYSDFSGELWDKPGIVRLEPGERRRWTMGVALEGVS